MRYTKITISQTIQKHLTKYTTINISRNIQKSTSHEIAYLEYVTSLIAILFTEKLTNVIHNCCNRYTNGIINASSN